MCLVACGASSWMFQEGNHSYLSVFCNAGDLPNSRGNLSYCFAVLPPFFLNVPVIHSWHFIAVIVSHHFMSSAEAFLWVWFFYFSFTAKKIFLYIYYTHFIHGNAVELFNCCFKSNLMLWRSANVFHILVLESWQHNLHIFSGLHSGFVLSTVFCTSCCCVFFRVQANVCSTSVLKTKQ